MVPFACLLLALLWLYLIFDKDGGDKERKREQGNEHATKYQPAGN